MRDYHTIDIETLNAQTLAQLRDLQKCLQDRIGRKLEAQSLEAKLAGEIAQEIKAEVPVTLEVALQTKIQVMSGYRPYPISHQDPEGLSDVQAFIEKIRTSINGRVTKERLEAFGLTEDSRPLLEFRILGLLR